MERERRDDAEGEEEEEEGEEGEEEVEGRLPPPRLSHYGLLAACPGLLNAWERFSPAELREALWDEFATPRGFDLFRRWLDTFFGDMGSVRGPPSLRLSGVLSLNEFQFLTVFNELTLLNEFEVLDLLDSLVKTDASRVPLDVLYLLLCFLAAVDAGCLHAFFFRFGKALFSTLRRPAKGADSITRRDLFTFGILAGFSTFQLQIFLESVENHGKMFGFEEFELFYFAVGRYDPSIPVYNEMMAEFEEGLVRGLGEEEPRSEALSPGAHAPVLQVGTPLAQEEEEEEEGDEDEEPAEHASHKAKTPDSATEREDGSSSQGTGSRRSGTASKRPVQPISVASGDPRRRPPRRVPPTRPEDEQCVCDCGCKPSSSSSSAAAARKGAARQQRHRKRTALEKEGAEKGSCVVL